ncbi:hypothetical protein FRB99_003289, partial [Tulasnella sp. 403]
MRIPTATLCVALSLALQLSAAPVYHSTTLVKRVDDEVTGSNQVAPKRTFLEVFEDAKSQIKNTFRKPHTEANILPGRGGPPPPSINVGDSLYAGIERSKQRNEQIKGVLGDSEALINQYRDQGASALKNRDFKTKLVNLAKFGSPDGTTGPLLSASTAAKDVKFANPYQVEAWAILLDPMYDNNVPTSILSDAFGTALNNGLKPSDIIVSRLETLGVEATQLLKESRLRVP